MCTRTADSEMRTSFASARATTHGPMRTLGETRPGGGSSPSRRSPRRRELRQGPPHGHETRHLPCHGTRRRTHRRLEPFYYLKRVRIRRMTKSSTLWRRGRRATNGLQQRCLRGKRTGDVERPRRQVDVDLGRQVAVPIAHGSRRRTKARAARTGIAGRSPVDTRLSMALGSRWSRQYRRRSRWH